MSSKLTSAQIIGLGEYLNADFDPASLTVSQLLGVLGFHNINYPTPYTKPKLIQVFNEQVKPKTTKFKKERLKKENSLASDDGILDGLTGQPIGGPKAVSVRRSSRRLSRAPAQDDLETSPVRPDPPKRRRSSAQPNLGGPSRIVAPVQPTLAEESEPEEELPVRKVGRSKKNAEAAGSQARRVSGPDSGWEDNNIFQSGAESSSPVRPSPGRPRSARKSVSTRKSRKSASAPPHLPPSSPSRLSDNVADDDVRPPQSNFNPDLPPSVARETRILAPRSKRSSINPVEHRRIVEELKQDDEDSDEMNLTDGPTSLFDRSDIVAEIQTTIGEEQEQDYAYEESENEEDQTVAVSRRIAEGGKALVRRGPSRSESRSTPVLYRIVLALFTLATSGAILQFKSESASIGYCDPGSNTNSALESLQSKWSAVEACNRENRTLLYLPPLSLESFRAGQTDGDEAEGDTTICPPPPLIPLPHPTECTPCPDHATCSQNSASCDTGYLLRPHPLLFFLPPSSSPATISLSTSSSPVDLIWKAIAVSTNGLPGLGSVGLPPRCVEDPKRKRNIGALGKAIESVLGQERGKRLCAGQTSGGDEGTIELQGGEAKIWGIDVDTLRDVMRERTPAHLRETFDDTFTEAIQQLTQWGGVIMGEDSDGKRYLAHKTPDLTWDCALTVKSREAWAEWRTTVFGAAAVIMSAIIARARRAQRLVEDKRVAEVVQIALDTLRNQELAYYTDPVTAPQPYLSSLQLRDLILQDEHSVSTRRRLWDKVERVVEGNTNVRASMEERGGDELRVWRWVGSAGRSPGVRKRVQFEGKAEA